MNEVKRISSDKVKINSDLEISKDLMRPKKNEYSYEDGFEFDYYEVLTQDDIVYKIDAGEYGRIFDAIATGVKFVAINDDLVNVNFIRKFKKKTGYKSKKELNNLERS